MLLEDCLNIPKKVNILGTDFTIIVQKPGFICDGLIKARSCEILLSCDIDEHYAKEVLHHEILHGVDLLIGNPTSMTEQALAGREPLRVKRLDGNILTEHEVISISRGLFSVYTDPRNARVMQWMFNLEKAKQHVFYFGEPGIQKEEAVLEEMETE